MTAVNYYIHRYFEELLVLARRLSKWSSCWPSLSLIPRIHGRRRKTTLTCCPLTSACLLPRTYINTHAVNKQHRNDLKTSHLLHSFAGEETALVTFCCCDKHPEKSHLVEERVDFILQDIGPHWRKSQQELERTTAACCSTQYDL